MDRETLVLILKYHVPISNNWIKSYSSNDVCISNLWNTKYLTGHIDIIKSDSGR